LKERARILVVDDDESVTRTFKVILEENGYVVDTAECGREAIEKTNKKFYNAIFIDIRLPDMEGTELLTKMELGVPRMRTVMITGYPSLESTVESLNLGADGYLIKPVEPRKLINIIEEKLKEQEVERLKLKLAEQKKQTKTMLKYYQPL